MIHAQNTKGAVMVIPQSLTTNDTATATVDTLGFDYCDIELTIDTVASTSNLVSVFSVTEGDVTNATEAIVAFTGGTATSTSVGFVIHNAASVCETVATLGRLFIDLKKRKRYLKVSITPDEAPQIMGVNAHLSRADVAPSTYLAAGAKAGYKAG